MSVLVMIKAKLSIYLILIMSNSGRKTIEYLQSEAYFGTTLLQKSDSQMPFLSLYITEYQIFAL